MEFDFFFKMVCTISFAGVTLCLCIKWIVESYLDYIQVQAGLRIITLNQLKDEEAREGYDNDHIAH